MPLEHNSHLPLAELDEQFWLGGLEDAGAACCWAICRSMEGVG